MLNNRLLKQQGLTDWDAVKIENLHTMLQSLFADMEYYYNPDDNAFELKECSKIITAIENLMQSAWKFPVHEDFHTHWYRAPHCTCPVLDNDDVMGLPYHIITLDCPLHAPEAPPEPEPEEQLSKWYEFWCILDDKRINVIKFCKWLKYEWTKG